jgi:DNA-binding NarL/FixJ family response regulator
MLSERERQIALLVVKGLTNKAIAKELSLAEGTVKVHLRTMYQKFGIYRRVKLAIEIQSELRSSGGLGKDTGALPRNQAI